jgi:hypothetical protein
MEVRQACLYDRDVSQQMLGIIRINELGTRVRAIWRLLITPKPLSVEEKVNRSPELKEQQGDSITLIPGVGEELPEKVCTKEVGLCPKKRNQA